MAGRRIVVSGFLGLMPAGGVAWDYVQYPVSFADLGDDVFYIEDTGLWPVFQEDGMAGGKGNAAYLKRLMDAFGLSGRWAYRDEPSGEWFGLSEARVREVLRSADVFVNVSCANVLRDWYGDIPVRILLDSDPMFTQVQIEHRQGFTKGAGGLADDLDGYTHFFSFGENIGEPDCLVPDCGLRWHPTRQPIALDRWPRSEPPLPPTATTVLNWSVADDIAHGGRKWGQKNREWRLIASLPSNCTELKFCAAVGQSTGKPFPRDVATAAGWEILDAQAAVPDHDSYRRFIEASAMEVSIAKHAYVAARSGWFSCRSACYLAAGRPVVVQDTGWSRVIEPGRGVVAFDTAEEASVGVAMIAADWQAHARAARAVAEEVFDGRKVLTDMLAACG